MSRNSNLTAIALEICHSKHTKAEQLLNTYQGIYGYMSVEEIMFIMKEVESTKRIWAMEEAEFKAHLNHL